jgi:hypothetical protein
MTPLSDPGYLGLVHSVISELSLPDKLTFDGLHQVVSMRRSRKLVVRRTEELRGSPVCAMTYSNEAVDLILFAPAEERRREDHFVCHEFGHLLLGHHERVRGNVMRPLPLLAPAMVSEQLKMAVVRVEESRVSTSSAPALGRHRSATCSTFTTIEEKRAESFADLLMEHMWRSNVRTLDEPVRFAEVFG